MRKAGAALMGLALLAGYVAVSTADYGHAREAHRHYCEMVASGAWPAYQGDENDC